MSTCNKINQGFLYRNHLSEAFSVFAPVTRASVSQKEILSCSNLDIKIIKYIYIYTFRLYRHSCLELVLPCSMHISLESSNLIFSVWSLLYVLFEHLIRWFEACWANSIIGELNPCPVMDRLSNMFMLSKAYFNLTSIFWLAFIYFCCSLRQDWRLGMQGRPFLFLGLHFYFFFSWKVLR